MVYSLNKITQSNNFLKLSEKIDEFFGYGNMYNGPTILRVINKKVSVGKGSRIRVLVMS